MFSGPPPPPPPPLPAAILALPAPKPFLHNLPSRPVLPSRRQLINRHREEKCQKAPRDSLVGGSTKIMQSPNSFPFLNLPREIRIMVYKYLVPNTKPREWCGKPQRLDGPCYPEILSVCRSIHFEAMQIFCCTPIYLEIDFSNNGIFFHGRRHPLSDPLPSTMRLAQSICIRIQLEWRTARQPESKKRIEEIFPADSRLQNLMIYFHATSPYYIGLPATPETVVSALDSTSSPLQKITKNLGTKFRIAYEQPIHQGRFNTGFDMNRVVTRYFRNSE